MKRRDFLWQTPAVLTLGLATQQLLAQTAVAGPAENGKKPSTAVTAKWATAHPRLYFPPARLAAFRARQAGNPTLNEQWDRMLRRADELTGDKLTPLQNAKQINFAGRQLSSMGMTLGLAWRMTGKELYARKLREALLHCVSYDRWVSKDMLRRTPSWHSDLNTAALTFGCATGYDAIFDFLSAAERKTIAEGLARLGILAILNDWVLPEKRIHALDSMGHNWWSVCVSGAGVGALALLGEDPRAAGWVQQVALGFELWFGYRGNVLQNKAVNFDAAGAFYESVDYANYALQEYLNFRLALSNAMPEYSQPRNLALAGVGDYLVQVFYPSSSSDLTVNFGDSSLHVRSFNTTILLLANGLGSAALRWYAQRRDGNSNDPLALLYPFKGTSPALPALPTSVTYPENGWAIMRSSWADNATLLAMKSGFTWNHAHADAGSFMLFHAGMPLIIDSGNCNYSRREYAEYYCQSRAHNVVLVGGQEEPRVDLYRGAKFSGRMHELVGGLGVKYVYADATGPMARYLLRNYRHWLWLEGAILIFDDLLAYEPTKYDWLLHYAGQCQRDGNNLTLTNGAAKAAVNLLYPAQLAVREVQGLADGNPDRKVSYLAFSTTESRAEQKFIAVILPLAEGRTPPEVELLRGPAALGVRLKHGRETTDVYLNLMADGRCMHKNANNAIAEWETDAYLFAMTYPTGGACSPETVIRWFVSAGSYLRHGGQTILDSLSQVTTVFQPGQSGRAMDVRLHGQDVIEAAFYCFAKPTQLKVNGRETAFVHEPDKKVGRLRYIKQWQPGDSASPQS